MDNARKTKISKFLSLVLRHEPQKIGITLDSGGWVSVRDLLNAFAKHSFALTRDELEEVVRTSDKKRFSFSDDGGMIRANQGHSVEVELGYEPIAPPEVLFHGTVERFLQSIRETGLLKGERHHVHLSRDEATAAKVGKRRGRPFILKIRAAHMHADGFAFFVSANGVWLTDHVPAKYIEFPDDSSSKAR
jgi:putative RNA 2'-phosphotransferase